MKEWFRLARERAVVIRALKFAIVVGTILIAINYWDTILHGALTPASFLKMGLTVTVPYVVSTASSVAAMRESNKKKEVSTQF